ncbi:MAG: flagellar biosynthesis protein [Cereibacter changlensis]
MAALQLEVFETGDPRAEAAPVDAAAEEARLAAYEQGYGAGWEDAMAAQAADQARLKADLGRNLQALGFTFHEARVHVLRAVEPLLVEVATHLLPALAREALAPLVLEVLMPLAEEMAERPLTLVLNPAARPAVEALLGEATGLPLTLVEEPTLGEGQVHLRIGDTETRIDLDRAIADIAAALRGFFDPTELERRHG